MSKKITQTEVTMEFLHNHAQQGIAHPEVVAWETRTYQQRTSEVFRGPDRQIRKFHQEGLLIKVAKDVYRYDPEHVTALILEDFSSQQKATILKRGNYRFIICGRGRQDGIELRVDHIKPKDKGGKATLTNGQTLCAMHNFRKKNFNQTETGKKMFIRLYEQAQAIGDAEPMDFCAQILAVFEKNGVNGHIE